MNVHQLETIPCNIVSSSDGLATVTFTIPEEHINGFVAMLNSLATLFRGLGWKTKTNIDAIHQREDRRAPGREQRIQQFETSCVETFQSYIKKGDTPREAFSLTVSAIKYIYEFSSYEIVRNVLTKHKLLKKTGYYKNTSKKILDIKK